MTARSEPHLVPSRDGTRIAVTTLRNDARPVADLLFVHATGFCKETWAPVVAELAARPAVVATAMDQRAHGDSDRPVPPFLWRDGGDDVLAVAATLETGRVIGIGHSSGAAQLALAEIADPSRFAGLLLIEPIIFPPPHGRDDDGPLVMSALRRRSRFKDTAAAFENFKGKGPFARWDDRALLAFAEGGLRYDPDGVWRLKCDPEDEAEFYRGGRDHQAWNHLDEIRCPVTLMAGAESATHPEPFVAALAARLLAPDVVIIPRTTHFLPMEDPRSVAVEIERLLTRIIDSGSGSSPR